MPPLDPSRGTRQCGWHRAKTTPLIGVEMQPQSRSLLPQQRPNLQEDGHGRHNPSMYHFWYTGPRLAIPAPVLLLRPERPGGRPAGHRHFLHLHLVELPASLLVAWRAVLGATLLFGVKRSLSRKGQALRAALTWISALSVCHLTSFKAQETWHLLSASKLEMGRARGSISIAG